MAVAIAATLALPIVSHLAAHFSCGGTLGGPGAAPDANLDRACLKDRQFSLLWLWPVLWLVAALAIRQVRRNDRD